MARCGKDRSLQERPPFEVAPLIQLHLRSLSSCHASSHERVGFQLANIQAVAGRLFRRIGDIDIPLDPFDASHERFVHGCFDLVPLSIGHNSAVDHIDLSSTMFLEAL